MGKITVLSEENRSKAFHSAQFSTVKLDITKLPPSIAYIFACYDIAQIGGI